MIVGVLVEITAKSVDKVFDYHVSGELESDIKIGIRVEVPFGRMKLEGFVVEIKENSAVENLRDIIRIIDKDIILNSELLEIGKIMHKKTLASLISCYQVMLPKALKAKKNVNINKRYDVYYKLGNISDYKFNIKQQEIVSLFEHNKLVSRKKLLEISSSSLKTLLNKGVLIEVLREHYRLHYDNVDGNFKVLTEDQERVVNSIDLNSSDTYLLHGVTGSGKTEVYISLIDKVIKKGQNAIMLVPEIALTPQMISRFSSVFGNSIATLHSALSEGEKYDEYRRISRGEARIVIGARSAVFAPLDNIGIIIIDEEHSDSYKQDNNPRYNAKDIAIIRSKRGAFPLVMGSATPSLDSYARAQKGVFKLLELKKRVNNQKLPKVMVVDMNSEVKKGNHYFSTLLEESIKERLKKEEQVILLLNRRGYSPYITCVNCGHVVKCPNCDITLTYHKSSNTLRCHYCGYGDKIKDICPSCGSKSFRNLGLGVEKVEELLNEKFSARVLRMDIDTTTKKGSHKKMIEAFKNHEYDILLGTQIVAKGLDFPNVTLVGVINADTSLNIPDFRSSENTFSLLSQVAGRSGRSNKIGEVIIQTYNKDHYAINYAKSHDYVGFYNTEMNIRRNLKYPPYFYLCYIRISGTNYDYLSIEANKIKKSLDKYLQNNIILGPSPATIFKVNKVYRYGIIIKYKTDNNLYKVLNILVDHYKNNNKINIDIDFNPNHF